MKNAELKEILKKAVEVAREADSDSRGKSRTWSPEIVGSVAAAVILRALPEQDSHAVQKALLESK